MVIGSTTVSGLFTEVLSLRWKTRQKDIEKDNALRDSFLRLLTALSARGKFLKR